MKKLKSDYIVKLIDVLETKNNYYIVQEYCDQGEFRHYLNIKGFLDEKEAKQVLVNLLSGFLELLKHGIIHRDLKPENILISTKNKQVTDLYLVSFSTIPFFKRESENALWFEFIVIINKYFVKTKQKIRLENWFSNWLTLDFQGQ